MIIYGEFVERHKINPPLLPWGSKQSKNMMTLRRV